MWTIVGAVMEQHPVYRAMGVLENEAEETVNLRFSLLPKRQPASPTGRSTVSPPTKPFDYHYPYGQGSREWRKCTNTTLTALVKGPDETVHRVRKVSAFSTV